MKLYLVQLFAYGKFYGQDSYRHGPFLIHADSAKRAVKYGVRELVASGKLDKGAGYQGKAVYRLIESSWLKSKGAGICPQLLEHYGHGFMFKWDKKKDKINLTEV